jgi:hypothetical protein
MGYVQVLYTPLVVAALTAKITLDSVEPEDRERTIDLLGKLDTVDPVVRIEDNTIVIEVLVSGSVKKFLRTFVEAVAKPLHELRRVVVVQLLASTADPATPYDVYR